MKIKYVMLFALGTMLCMSSCGQKKDSGAKQVETSESTVEVINETKDSVKAETEKTPQEEVILIGSSNLNDAARFVAGLPVSEKDSKLYGLTQTAEWKSHARNMDQIWNSFMQTNPKVTAFAQEELSDINEKCNNLFYPFGGPDFLFSNTFFPDIDTYFLIGLERAGSAVEVKHPSVQTYRLYQNAVSDILNLSFFRTKDMKKELSNDTIDGVIPIITLLMARADREIVSIEYKRLDDNGKFASTKEDGSALGRTNLVEIKYFKRGSGRQQTLYYMSTDLSNGGFPRNKGLQAYINNFDKSKTVTFIKSASYLMHEKYFSNIRDMILDHSSAIMQDDSGIPWTFFDEDKWDMTLYGTFLKPIKLFSECPQPELRDAYQVREAKPLNFRIGYARQSNLQVARLK